MEKLMQRFVFYLKEENKQDVADVLKGVELEFVDVQEAFELGRVLQHIFDLEAETSSTGFTEKEIEQMIKFVKSRLRQAKY